MSSRIPPLLEPYLTTQPSEESLTLVTSVLGASSNWLVLRYLYAYLRGASGAGRKQVDEDGDMGDDLGVVLVSFMRDWAFWKEGAGKMGLDLDAKSRAGKVVFVDGLTGLLTDPAPHAAGTKHRMIRKPGDVQKEIEAALADLGGSKKILVVDQMDALPALAAPDDGITSWSLGSMMLSLREHVQATLLTLSADAPLVQSQTTTLEREHAALVLSMAHVADRVMALRMLDTGTARDVSGVVRITAGGAGEKEIEDGDKEYLYFVAGDGSVKVFERGA